MIRKFLAAIFIKVSNKTLKRHSAFDVLMCVSECVLCHIQLMHFFCFYSVAASQKVEKEKMGDLKSPKFLEKKSWIVSKNE